MPSQITWRGRALLSLGVLAVTTYLLLTTAPRLGLDLRGGTQMVLETSDSPTVTANAETTDRTLEVLRRRVDALGVAEPVLHRSGERRIVVELPDVQDPREAAEVVGRTAQLTFHPVVADGGEVLTSETGEQVRVGPAVLSGDGVASARSGANPQGAGHLVSVEFRDTGKAAWEKLTATAACAPPGDPARRVAIVLDETVISSPQVDPSIACEVGMTGGSTDITGRFSQAEAADLALLISAGALPVPVEIVEQRTVGPTLGEEAIDTSARAAVIGLVLIALFLIAVYRLAGLVSVFALAAYAGVSYAALLAIGATLTLPGLAGFVLAIGMAVDATVLAFERAREEYSGSLPRAADQGFRGALSAIVDSNVTTLLAAGLLFLLASGPVRGFGVTLTIGVLASMFTSLVLTRVLTHLAMTRARPAWSGLAHEGRVRRWVRDRDPGFLARPRRWLVAAGLAVVVALAGLLFVGPRLGVEFTGGRLFEYTTPASADEVRTALTDAGFPRAVVQDTESGVTIRTEPVDDAEATRIQEAVGPADKVRDELVGPSLGAELRNKALVALALAIAAQLAYLAIRFDWRLGLATVLALAQDVLLLLGIFTWLGRTMDGVFLAALLTVIGYSVNDTVVVFDRVRELRGKRSFPEAVGSAVLQTLPRTINTGIGVLFVLGALLFLGDGSLADFALALLLGLVIGTVSTVVTAGPAAIMLDKRWPGAGRVRAPKKEREGSGAVI